MHLTSLQILGPDWLKLASMSLPWRLEPAGGQTPATGIDAIVMRDNGRDDSWAVVVASYLWTRMGGFDESFVLPYVPDFITRISILGRVGYVQDQDAAGVCLLLGDGLEEQWAKQLSCLPPAYQDQTEDAIRMRIRQMSDRQMGEGKVIRERPPQSVMWCPAIRAKPVLLELLVIPMPVADDEEEQPDWGDDADLPQIALITLRARGADFLAAASTWSPAEPAAAAAAAAAPPVRGSACRTLCIFMVYIHTCLCSCLLALLASSQSPQPAPAGVKNLPPTCHVFLLLD